MNLARSGIRVPANVTIRPARDADLELLARWNTSIDRVVEPTLRRQNAGEAVVLLALVEPWPVGHLLVDFVALASENAAHLWHMGVHDSVISRGIGSELIATAERMSAERGLRNSALEVETTNTDALRLYQRLGYAIVGERDEFWPEPDERSDLQEVGHPCWLMRKDISGARRSSDRPELSPWARSPSWCPRPEVSPQLLAAVRQAHGIAWAGEPVDLGGSSNLNLRLRAAQGHADHVLRVHRAWVTLDRLSAIHSVRRHLAERGLPVVEAVAARSGAGWIRVGENLAEVEPFVEGEDMDRGETLLAGISWLARLHAELSRIPVSSAAAVAPTANHVGAQLVLPTARRAAAMIRSWASTADEKEAATSIENLAQAISLAEGPYADQLPRQLVHGDFWDNNVLFRDDKVAAILDFDFMEERPRIDDVALVLYYACTTAVESHGTAGTPQALAALVRAYADAASPPLIEVERLDLPIAIARTCLHFTRHLAQRVSWEEQRQVVEANLSELAWGAAMIHDLERWQEAFAQ